MHNTQVILSASSIAINISVNGVNKSETFRNTLNCYAVRHHAAYLFIKGLITSCNGLNMFLLSKLRFWHKICVSSSNSSSCLLGNNFDNVLAGTLVLSPKYLSATCTNYTLVLAIVKIHRTIVIGNDLYFLSSDSERRGLNSVLFVP